ncbi:MAG: helix-turn-helix transcriptional regulator [Roseburia lenta]|nr:helix-turn-helix transcriptional regulator [Roseburia lenta]
MKINKQKLQIAMANACLSMDDLAEIAKISRISLTKYISGNTEPRTKTLGKIAKALNVPVENLIDLEGAE